MVQLLEELPPNEAACRPGAYRYRGQIQVDRSFGRCWHAAASLPATGRVGGRWDDGVRTDERESRLLATRRDPEFGTGSYCTLRELRPESFFLTVSKRARPVRMS